MKESGVVNSDEETMGDRRAPIGDLVAEGRGIVQAAAEKGLSMRLLGGAAIQFLTRDEAEAVFRRVPQDIDFVCHRQDARRVGELMIERGYRADEMFNAVNGHRRLLFFDDENSRQVDIFLGEFSMCHVIPLEDRIELAEITLPRVELLLMKLQIFELNPKDQGDILHLLHYSEIGSDDASTINAGYLADLCSRDWGLWRTVTLNLERTRNAIESSELDGNQRALVLDRVEMIQQALDQEPKSRRWRMRARVGDRVQWYELPEEVD